MLLSTGTEPLSDPLPHFVLEHKLLRLFVVFANKRPDDKPGTPLVGEQAIHPVTEYDKFAAETDEIVDMHEKPDNPGKETAHMPVSGQIGYGPTAADNC